MLGPLDCEVNPGSDFFSQAVSCMRSRPPGLGRGSRQPGQPSASSGPVRDCGTTVVVLRASRRRPRSWSHATGKRPWSVRRAQRQAPSDRRCPLRAFTDGALEGGRAAGPTDQARSVPSGSVTTTRTLALGAEGRQKPLGSTRSTATRKTQVRLPGFMRRLDPRLRPVRNRLSHPCTPTCRAAPGALGRTASARKGDLRRT